GIFLMTMERENRRKAVACLLLATGLWWAKNDEIRVSFSIITLLVACLLWLFSYQCDQKTSCWKFYLQYLRDY
ncbi:MAG: hypothetical protein ACJAT1_002296, partial [Marivirga sp.]